MTLSPCICELEQIIVRAPSVIRIKEAKGLVVVCCIEVSSNILYKIGLRQGKRGAHSLYLLPNVEL